MAINKRLINTGGEVVIPTSFNTVTYSGSGATGQNVGGVGFQADLVWIKSRTASLSNVVHDVLRGQALLITDSTTAEINNGSNTVVSTSDGFTLQGGDSHTSVNEAGTNNFVAWCWKAGGAAVTNTDGSITSEVSANVDAGFSVVKYIGNGTSGATVGHGLGVEADYMIFKRLNATESWNVWNRAESSKVGFLNLINAFVSYSILGSTTTNITLNNGTGHNVSSSPFIAYCFAEKAGFSKFGSYSGSVSDVSVTTGFEPAFVMVKSFTGAYSWYIIDNKRGATSPTSNSLFANLSNGEAGGYGIYFDSNGFTVSSGVGSGTNSSGNTYIYMAFANQF